METGREMIDLVRQRKHQTGEPLNPEAEQLLGQEQEAATSMRQLATYVDSNEFDNKLTKWQQLWMHRE
eukprot:scaffold153134_cov20-Prasinocladus_malaysianus.AAC.1